MDHQESAEAQSRLAFGIDVATRNATTVITLSGDFDLASAKEFSDATEMDEAAAVVFDLRELTFIDSTGLVAMLGYVKSHPAASVTLIVEDRVHRTLEIAGLLGDLAVLRADDPSAKALLSSE